MRKLRIVFLGATLAVLTAGVASAAIPAADGTISACYDKQTGQLRLTDPATGQPKPCGQKENAVSWNVQGVPGQDGADGVSGYERVVVSSDLDSYYDKNAWALCPEGKKAIGGGAGVFGLLAGGQQQIIYGVALIASIPFNADGWTARASEIVPVADNWKVTVYAICAFVN